MYHALHVSEFADSDAFCVTKNKRLLPHGIIVCTVGHLPAICRKYPSLVKVIYDLVTDESGQIWEWTAMEFLPSLPNLHRLAVFGHDSQVSPYVTKLMKQDIYFPSLMTALKRHRPHPVCYVILM